MRGALLLCILLFTTLCCAFEGNYEEDHPSHVRATDHWAVEVHPGVDADALAAEHGYVNLGPVGTLQDVYLFTINSKTRGLHKPIHQSPSVKWAENQVEKKRFQRALPTDPLFSQQWHLKSTNGIDVNVEGAWSTGLTGAGITIAVVDDGLQKSHPDIAPNFLDEGSWDFNQNDAFPDPHYGDDHGTSAGGVAAARDNNDMCGTGAAPYAKLSGIRLIADYTTDAQEAAGLSFRTDINDIYTNSWGPNDDGKRLEKPGPLTLRAMENAVLNGRGGKGSIYVWAGGNGRSQGDNCNYDGYANSRFSISIGAVDNTGKQAYYSESCADLIASAPSSGNGKSITTVDLLGTAGTNSGPCTSSFGGTSAAAPLVAGVVALVLQANPNLGWRDIQDIFVTTSKKVDEHDADWVVNGGGFHHNHKYGFGLVDSTAATEAARTHVNFPAVEKVATSKPTAVDKALNDRAPVSSTIPITDTITVENVEVYVKATHGRRGDLYITLTSPAGTTSVLQEVHGDGNANIDWTYSTVRSWGETSFGNWVLTIEDRQTGVTGTFKSWQLNVYGH